jgi:hypothetical protein
MPTPVVRTLLFLVALVSLPLSLAAQSSAPLSIALAGLRTVDSGVASNTASFPAVQMDSTRNIYLLLDENDGVRILKLNPAGSTLLASAHIGRAGDHGVALAFASNQLFVAGIAGSGSLSATSGAAENFPAVQSSFLAGFSTSLSLTFLTSTGGSLASATSLSVVSGAVYVAGSILGKDLPVTGNAAILTFPAASAATGFVEVFNASGSALNYASYLGGANGSTFPAAIAADASGNIYVTGSNTATGFPTVSALQSEMIGSSDLFLTQLSPANGLEFSTLLGTADGTVAGSSLAVSSGGTLYVGVNATALGLPISDALVNLPVATNWAMVMAFPTSGSSITASTVLGDGFLNALSLDGDGNLWAVGKINHVAAWALTNDLQHEGSAFVTELDAQGELLFSTRVGGITAYASDIPQTATSLSGMAVATDGTIAVSGSWNSLMASSSLLPGALDLPYVNAPSAALPGTLAAALSPSACQNSSTSCGAAYVATLSPSIAIATAVSVDTIPNLTIRNLGQSAETFTAISSSGYVSSSDCVAAGPIASGAACNILLTGNGPGSVTFTTAAGSSTIPVTGAALSSAQYSVAIQPRESIFSFDSATEPLMVSNLTSQAQSFEPPSNSLAEFSLVEGSRANACIAAGNGVYSVPANSICTINAVFLSPSLNASQDGPATGFVAIQGSGQTANVAQFAAYPLEEASTTTGGSGLVASATSLDFGTQYIGGLTLPRTVVLTNVSSSAIVPNFVSTPPSDPNFQVTDLCPVTLPALASCLINVTYSSPVTSSDSTPLELPNGTSLQLTGQTVQAPGAGGLSVNPNISASPSSLSFSAAGIGNSTTPQSVTLSNAGNAVAGITIGVTANFTQSNNCAGSVPAAGSCTIQVSFAPSSLGVLFGQLSVTPTGSSAVNIALTGGGVSSIDFGSISFGTQTTQWISLGSISGTVTATVQGPFQIAAVNGYQYATPPSIVFGAASTTTCTENCYVGVRAIPTSAGSINGTLTLTPQSGVSLTYAITAKSLYQPAIVLSTHNYDYGSIPLHSSSAFALFTVTNPGASAVSLSAATASSGFALQSGCGSTLSAGASCIIGVAFAPTAAGVATGQLSVTGGGSTVTAQLSGNAAGDPAEISFTPATLLFYSPSGAASQTVTLTNMSSQSRAVTSIDLGLGSFFTQSSTCGTLAPSASCAITFSATSVPAGTDVTAPVSISVNTGTVTYPYTLAVSALPSGMGAASISLQATPASLTFASTSVGNASNPEFLTVTNNSSSTQSILVTPPAGFSVDNTSCLTLAAGASCTMPVRFLPYSAGQTSDTISIQAYGQAIKIAVSGFGIPTTTLSAPAYPPLIEPISLSPNPQGDGTTQLLKITNAGPQKLLINGISASDVIVANDCPVSLASGASCNLTLQTIVELGCGDSCNSYSQESTVTLFTNAVSSPDTYTVDQTFNPSGSSTEFASFIVTTGSLTFPQTAVGNTSLQTFRIESTGGISLPIAFTTTGDFTEADNCGGSLAAWQSGSYPFCTVTVTFKPATPGFRVGSLLLITGAGTQPISLAGNGPAPTGLVPTLTTLQASANSFSAGENAALTATVTAVAGTGTPTGSVSFSVGSTLLATVALQNGIAKYSASTTGLSAGVYPVVAQYKGSTSDSSSVSATLDVTINGGGSSGTTTTLTATPQTLTAGDPVTLSATVAPKSGSGTPGGTVTFLSGSTNLGSSSLTGGVATFAMSTSGLANGAYSISASYAGDSSNAPSASAPVIITVTGTYATQTTLTASPPAPVQGQNVSLKAVVNEVSGSNTPAGTVSFLYGPLQIGTAQLIHGSATLTASSAGLPADLYSIKAHYVGDSQDLSSTSSAVSVNLKASTAVLLSASPSSVTAGQNVTLTATVRQTSGSGTPGGNVSFIANGSTLGSATVFGGVATFTVSTNGYPAGTYSITGAYSGDNSDGSSNSKAVNVTVQ